MAKQLAILDTRDSNAVKNYEKAFFRGFGTTPPEDLADIFDYDFKTRRLRTKIPYTDQTIYVATVDGTVMAAVAVNFNMAPPLQLETYGFTVPQKNDVAEGLALFSLDAPRGTLFSDLGAFAEYDLQRRGIRWVFGTCEPRRLSAYQLIGFTLIDEREHMGDAVYLIRMAIEPA